MTWELPQDWQDAIANPDPDALLDPAVLAATVFFQEHAFIYGLERANELQPEVMAAISRAQVDPTVSVARILDGAGWTDERLANGPSAHWSAGMADDQGITRATLDAAFASLLNPQYRPTPMVLPPGEVWLVSDPMPPRSEFQRLVDEAVLAGEHVHTFRGGELRCVMGDCDS